MAAHARLKNELTGDEKCHNPMSWLVWFPCFWRISFLFRIYYRKTLRVLSFVLESGVKPSWNCRTVVKPGWTVKLCHNFPKHTTTGCLHSHGEEVDGLFASRAFFCFYLFIFARASCCQFSLPPNDEGWLWFVILTLPGLFYLLFDKVDKG